MAAGGHSGLHNLIRGYRCSCLTRSLLVPRLHDSETYYQCA